MMAEKYNIMVNCKMIDLKRWENGKIVLSQIGRCWKYGNSAGESKEILSLADLRYKMRYHPVYF